MHSNMQINKYRVGDKVNVYYSKSKPSYSTLNTGTTKVNLLGILGSAVFFVFGLVMYLQRELYVKDMPE